MDHLENLQLVTDTNLIVLLAAKGFKIKALRFDFLHPQRSLVYFEKNIELENILIESTKYSKISNVNYVSEDRCITI